MTPEPRTVHVAVADPRLRHRLRDHLSRRSDMVWLGETGDVAATARALRRGAPDIVLLDLLLPGGAGFEMIETIGVDALPAVIFITPLDSGRLRALEIHALDYLVEPFDDAALHAALDRARHYTSRFALAGLGRRLERLVAGDEEGSRARRIAIKSASQQQYVPLDEIRWVEGAGSFARLHLYDGRTHLLRESLDSLGERFADDFLRVHRSTLVRSSEVEEILREEEGDARVRLRDGTELRVSRRFRERLEPVDRPGP